jgi:hypothetical protein
MMPLSRVPRARQDHAIGNLIEDHPMTALGNVPCNGSRACCLHDMTRPMPERGDLIWIFEHEVMATAAGPTAILQCFLSKCFLSKCFPAPSSRPPKCALGAAVVARAASSSPPSAFFYFGGPE